MKTITFDTGMEEYQLMGGVLRFNPADPNVYVRFRQACDRLQQLEQDMTAELSTEKTDVLAVMARTDRAIKETLNQVFGPGNDFDKLLGGVNLLATASDGKPVVQHLFAALEPVLLAGAKRCAREQAAAIRE